MRIYILITLQVLLCAYNASAGTIVKGVVKAVYDGDTVAIAIRGNSKLKIRLYGIDAPETKKYGKLGQPYGDKSKRALMLKLMGRQISAEIMDFDEYKRTVGIIRYSGRDINQEMVSEGMAWAYRQYLHTPYATHYIGAENLARSRHIGLWRASKPQPPWKFRKSHKEERRHSAGWW